MTRNATGLMVRRMLRFLRIAGGFVAAFVVILLLVAVVVYWRLSSSAVSSSFLTPYVEAAIERALPGASATIQSTLLTWDNVDRSVALHAEEVTIRDAHGHDIALVPKLDIQLSAWGVLIGRMMPAQLVIDHPQLRLDRHKDGHLYFAGLSTESTEASVDQQASTRDALREVLRELTANTAMRHITIYRAAIAVSDEASKTNWAISVPEVSLRREMSKLAGDVKVDLTQKEGAATLRIKYEYDPMRGLHFLSTKFADIVPSQLVGGHPETIGLGIASMIDLPLSGEISVAVDPDLALIAANVAVQGGKGVLVVPSLWDKPRSIASFDIAGSMLRSEHRLEITKGAVDFGTGAKLDMTVASQPAAQADQDVDLEIKLKVADLPMDGFEDYWPKTLVPDARDWMVPNMRKGRYDSADGAFKATMRWDDLGSLKVIAGGGTLKASGADVYYMQGMPPVVNVSADATYDLDKMVLQIKSGNIGALKLKPFPITITGLSEVDQYIDVPMLVAGPITDVLALIDHEPLRYAHAVGLTPDDVAGQADAKVMFRFPLLKDLYTKDIDITAHADLTNVTSSRLVKGVNMEQGALGFDLEKTNFITKGTANLNKAPFRITWQQFFHKETGKPYRRGELQGVIIDDQWKSFGVDALAGTKGGAATNLKIEQLGGGKTSYVGNVDFSKAELNIDMLRWKKPAGIPASFQFTAEEVDGKPIDVKSLELRSPQATIKGRAVMTGQGDILSADLPTLVVGRSNASLIYTHEDSADGKLKFDIQGASMDISGMNDSKDGAAKIDTRPREYRIKVDKLLTGENGVLTKAEGFAVRDRIGWSAISLRGLADGEHPLSIELTPQPNGQSKFLLTCDDFGKMLKGLGITDTVREGAVTITGKSAVDNPRAIEGRIKVGGFSVRKLPALMLLINATSPFGLLSIVTDSISFNWLDGSFRWLGDDINFQRVNIPGSSVGLNFDGTINMNSGAADLKGTLVPFSMVNQVLGAIPVIGDLLTGGNGGGVLAVSFGIGGKLADPKVSVNPVSLLTPGFLRTLFFDNGNDENDEAPADATPQQQPARTGSNININK